MAETTPLLPSASSGPSRRLRTSAAAAVIGLLLALVLVASLSASKLPVALESDGEHDSAFAQALLALPFFALILKPPRTKPQTSNNKAPNP